MIMREQHAWLHGRGLLMGEIEGRVRELRMVIDRRGGSNGFRAGLVLFLERRMEHLREVMAGVLESHCSDSTRRQSLDRMLAAIVGTLRHVELELSVDVNREPERGQAARQQRQGSALQLQPAESIAMR